MRANRTVLLGAAAAMAMSIVASPAAADRGPVWEIDWEDVEAEAQDVRDFAASIGVGVTVETGEIAGAAYITAYPDDWNGDLVVYAHGYRGEGPNLYVDAPPAFQFLTSQGYAWAASSYRRNSYDPGIGVLDTKNLTRHAQAELGPELDKSYLTGFSMGGHVTAAAIETYPNLYDGAMPACGVLGDVELFDYFLDYNVGAAALAGIEPDYAYPTDTWVGGTVADVKAELSSFDDFGLPDSLWAFDGSPLVGAATDLLSGPGEDFKDFVEVGSGGERVGYDLAWDYWHAASDGNFFFDLGEGDGTIGNRKGIASQNSDMSYAVEYGVDIDDEVKRIDGASRIRKAQGNKPAPIVNGTPSIPVLSIHTTGDLFVPIEMEQIYAQEVAANGLSDNLVQRAIRDVGHCSFTGDELVQSYVDLFTWVETGVRPAGEDLVNDISDPNLGCEWTTGAGGTFVRPLFEPCP